MKPHVFVLLTGMLSTVRAFADQDLVNEDWVLPRRDFHSLAFALTGSTSVHIQVTPVRDVGKGVTLRVVPTDDFDACTGKAKGACRSRAGFEGLKVVSFDHAEEIPAGRWTFYVANTENLIKSATVHVHIVAGTPSASTSSTLACRAHSGDSTTELYLGWQAVDTATGSLRISWTSTGATATQPVSAQLYKGLILVRSPDGQKLLATMQTDPKATLQLGDDKQPWLPCD